MYKNLDKVLKNNPALAREMAKILKEELDQEMTGDTAVEVTDLTTPEVSTGDNAHEVAAEAPAPAGDVTAETVLGDGHSVDPELTANDPVDIDAAIAEIPIEELDDEVQALEEVKEENDEEVEELDNIIAEATALRNAALARNVLIESTINKVQSRILTEAVKILAKDRK